MQITRSRSLGGGLAGAGLGFEAEILAGQPCYSTGRQGSDPLLVTERPQSLRSSESAQRVHARCEPV